MKKHAIVMALLSAGLMSQAVNAAPSSSILEWRGFVSGAFAGTDIGLTGQGGGDIQTGELSINDDGAFTSARAIIVEAHAMDDTGPEPVISPELYDGDVDWSISATNVSHAAYELSDIAVSMNGEPIAPGTPLTTTAGNHTVGFSVSSPAPADASMLTPGDAVSVTTMVFAEPSTGAPATM
ncbi:hypothetical protein [Vibrio alginolyticus]|uniref:hypothetical protein n=1 Tax=Vibrio alginolyticus TaxID=663 RepID=UPI0007210A8A|nr:hypothetical protein [Vibrio alginolyticus]ALR95507.1 hypothetical protein AT730_24960 [Vibrio alginolyticus]ALR95815.1 hypothetical protein AT730_24700 [Vibrio alginolyticus]MBY7710591.1 hypothetical protein [Vibrio alginolyticus]